jgi:hypothetical protein
MPAITTRIGILAVAAAATVAGGSAAALAAPKQPSQPARVAGTAQIRLTYWPDQDVRTFAFDVRAVPFSDPKPGAPHGLPTDARGTVRFSHHSPAEGWTVRSEAAVDCMITSPGGATLTAVVTRADRPDDVGKRLGFSVHDGGEGGRHDRMGFSWSVANGVENEQGEWEEGKVGTCMGPAAFAPVTKGGYDVEHADLLPFPSD